MAVKTRTLTPELLTKIDAYWRAATTRYCSDRWCRPT